jgi:hypothetical protein
MKRHVSQPAQARQAKRSPRALDAASPSPPPAPTTPVSAARRSGTVRWANNGWRARFTWGQRPALKRKEFTLSAGGRDARSDTAAVAIRDAMAEVIAILDDAEQSARIEDFLTEAARYSAAHIVRALLPVARMAAAGEVRPRFESWAE